VHKLTLSIKKCPETGHFGRKKDVETASSSIQTILSVWELHPFSLRSRTIPPVGKFTLPWRFLYY